MTYNPCSAESQEIRGLKLPATNRATSACCGTPLLYLIFYVPLFHIQVHAFEALPPGDRPFAVKCIIILLLLKF